MAKFARRVFWLLAVTAALSCSRRTPEPIEIPAAPNVERDTTPEEARDGERPLKVPSGDVPRLTCAEARAIVAEVRHRLPAEPAAVRPELLAELWTDWFDPHGLWSVAADSPLAGHARTHAPALLAELQASDTSPCVAALKMGAQAKRWVDGLRSVFEQARAEAPRIDYRRAFQAVNEPAFEDEVQSHSARELARDLGHRIGQFSKAAPERADVSADAALARFFPDLGVEGWSEAVLAALVRAYVPAIDPHGQWAPLDEEWSLFAGDPLDGGEPALWGAMLRTPLGVRVVEAPRAPLELDDLVVAIDGLPTAGLSVEQVEQLSRVEPPRGQSARTVRVLRAEAAGVQELSVALPHDEEEGEGALSATRVRYGSKSALVVPIAEVSDHLGDDLADLLAAAREEEEPVGVVLDLRGNGGGSTDGAAAAIGLFLPGVPSFPLLHRGAVSEVMRASTPDAELLWRGPLAVLVDGYTASAAEMIAGAIDGYGRGPLLGAHTFGKGCVQEYFDDHSARGVLRLTTLLVALPDGSPLQQVGLEPEWLLGLPASDEREADLEGSPHGVSGPDVRNRAAMGAVPWPSSSGQIGPCDDPVVCRALSRLGTGVPVRRSRAANPGPPNSRRTPRPRPVLGDAEHSAHGFTQSREGRGTSPR